MSSEQCGVNRKRDNQRRSAPKLVAARRFDPALMSALCVANKWLNRRSQRSKWTCLRGSPGDEDSLHGDSEVWLGF
jgi:hypothetical protein